MKEKETPIIRLLGMSFLAIQLLARTVSALDPVFILTPSDFPSGMARAVAISGDYIALGVPDVQGGAVYVFRRLGPTWIEQAKLTASDWQFDDLLGWSVAMDGDVIVAGAPRWNFPFACSSGPGAAYVFRRHDNGTPSDPWDDVWHEEAKLTVPDSSWSAALGYSVAISDGVIVIGQPYFCNKYPGSGEVFRRAKGQWIHEESLYGSDAQENTTGWSVDIDQDRIVLGAGGQEGGEGAVYVFEHDGVEWTEQAKLSAYDGTVGGFGSGVSVSGDWIMAGGPGIDEGPAPYLNTGAAYPLRWTADEGWQHHEKFSVNEIFPLGGFGQVISCDSMGCLIGRDAIWDPRSAYLFELVDETWVQSETLNYGLQPPFGISLSGPYAGVLDHVYVVRNRKDVRDFSVFQNCFGQVPCDHACQKLRPDSESDIDLVAFEEFMATFGGP